jgi:hypothetical protein
MLPDCLAAVTVTSQVAVLSPAFAVIVASPTFTAVTTPFSTVATVLSLEVHVTLLSVALSGFTVAVSVSVSLTPILVLVLFSSTLVTATVPESSSLFLHEANENTRLVATKKAAQLLRMCFIETPYPNMGKLGLNQKKCMASFLKQQKKPVPA